MSSCLIKQKYIGNTDQLNTVIRLMKDTYGVLREPNTPDFYNELIERLKKDSPFLVEYSANMSQSEKRLYKQSIDNLISDILHNIPKHWKNINSGTLATYFTSNQIKESLGIPKQFKLQLEETNFVIEAIGAQEDTNISDQDLSRFIDNYYENCFGAIQLMRKQFKTSLFQRIIINFDRRVKITTNEDLNESISNFKEELYKNIINFLKTKYPDNQYSDTLYSKSGNINTTYFQAIKDMYKFLTDNNEELINPEYIKYLDTGESDTLKAIFSFTYLQYFDSLVNECAGKIVHYDKSFKNQEVKQSLQKYTFSNDTSHQRKSWTDNENRTAIQNTSRFSKFVLDNLPLEVDGKATNKTLGASKFYAVICKLFSNVSYLDDSKCSNETRSKLVPALIASHSAPDRFIQRIFQLIKENPEIRHDLINVAKFSNDDLYVIDSFYDYVLSDNLFSIKSIEDDLVRRNNPSKFWIFNDLINVIDDCVDATYFYTEYQNSGEAKSLKREKFKDRRLEEKFKQSLNAFTMTYPQDYRKTLQKGCIINHNNSTQDISVRIPLGSYGNLNIHIYTNKLYGILHQTSEIYMEDQNGSISLESIYKLFSQESPIDLSLKSVRSEILSNVITDDNIGIFKSILQFIDDRLHTNFLSENGLQKLNIFNRLSNWDAITDLLIYSIKAQEVSNIYYDFQRQRMTLDSKYKNLKDFLSYLKEVYPSFKNISDNELRIYFTRVSGIYLLNVMPESTAWPDSLVKAEQLLYGDDSKSVSKNQEGNNDANYVTSFLGAQIQNLNLKARQGLDSNASKPLLFTDNSRLIKQVVINSDIKNRFGTIKAIRKLNPSEVFYNSIVHNFWLSYLNSKEFCIQPTTYSDKVKIIHYLIDASRNIKGLNKSLDKLSINEIITLYANTLGQAASNSLTNTVNKYRQLFGNITIPELQNVLKNYSEEQLLTEANSKGIKLTLDLDYRVEGDHTSLNEILIQESQYANPDILREKLELEKVHFVNDLVDSGIQFYVTYSDTTKYMSKEEKATLNSNRDLLKKSTSPIAKIILSLFEGQKNESDLIEGFMKKWVYNGKLVFGYSNEGTPILYQNTDNVKELNPILEKYFYLNSLLSNNLRLSLTGFETNHPDKSEFKKFFDAAVPQFITEPLSEEDKRSIDEYDLVSMQFSSNLQIRNLAKYVNTIIENYAQSTQLKRNVIIPATLHYVHNYGLNHVTKKIKVAVIEDMPCEVFNFKGDQTTNDAMDGSAYTTMEESILENYSLGSQEVGEDKKPIWHHYDHGSATASLMKFASYAINNERMRMSMNSKVPLIRMFKKMMDIQWDFDIDLTHPGKIGKKSKKLRNDFNFFKEVLMGNSLYYKTYNSEGQVIYKQILDFKRDENGNYYTVEVEVDSQGSILDYAEDGNPLTQNIYHFYDNEYHQTLNSVPETGQHTINSLYELWLALGGVNSQSLDHNNLVNSESSHYAVVGFMNVHSYLKEGANPNDISQNSYYQPLKESMIGYLTNQSAMKNGTTNRNLKDSWFNDQKLRYMEMDSDGLGIQMDADHDLEEVAEMTEFSQVISALEAGGYLHKYAKLVYQDLGRIAVLSSKMEIDSVVNYLAANESDKSFVRSQLYEIIAKTLIKGIKSKNDQSSLTDNILKAVEKRFGRTLDHYRDFFKLPTSDANIYSQILPTIISIINSKSIKRKFNGTGSVLCPAFNVVQLFKIGDANYTFDDLVRKAQSELSVLPIFDGNTTKYELTLVNQYLAEKQQEELIEPNGNKFIPTDIVNIILSDGSVRTIALDTPQVYYSFKDLQRVLHLLEDKVYDPLIDKVCQDLALTPQQIISIIGYQNNVTLGRNLAPARITFETEQGVQMNVFDLPLVRECIENPTHQNQQKVKQAFRDLDNGFFLDLDGNKVKIQNLSSKAAQCVLSNFYPDIFDISNTTLAEIEEKGPKALEIKYVPPRDSENYDLIFSNDRENTYISFHQSQNDTFEPYKTSELLTIKDDLGNLDIYLMSKNNRPLLKVGRYVKKNGYSYLDGKYIDENNQVLSQQNRYKALDDTVYEQVLFVTHWINHELVENENEVSNTESTNKYIINVNKLKSAYPDASQDQINHAIANVLDSIWNMGSYTSIDTRSTIDNNIMNIITNDLVQMRSIPKSLKSMVVKPLTDYIINSRIKNRELESLDVRKFIRKKYKEYYQILSKERYNSWLLSQYVTSARIPAQTLQSFMQMENVAYTGNTLNKAYVSVWQLWLQGSDLDIDKAYIMGFSFDKGGKFIGWSNLFDYSSFATLQQSLKLPMPRRIKITTNQNEIGFNIDKYIRSINAENRISVLAELITDYYDFIDKTGITNIIYSENIGEQIIKDLISHESTPIPLNIEEDAIKNSVSSRIQFIIQSLPNMVNAYSPITMDDLSDASNQSEKGTLVASMSLMNPLTKYLMQTQNMTGKDVIGITAVGEKVFFNLSYYYNEGLRSNDPKWIERMQFQQTFNRIQGRSKNNLRPKTVTALANINFLGHEELRERFLVASQIDEYLREKYNISDQDITEQNQKWEQYAAELNSELTKERISTISTELNGIEDVDLMISQLLSAATD